MLRGMGKFYIFLPVLCTLSCASFADDAVGWMRVGVPSNDIAIAVLPFSPLGESHIGSLLAGPFVGDGKKKLKTRLRSFVENG